MSGLGGSCLLRCPEGSGFLLPYIVNAFDFIDTSKRVAEQALQTF